MKSVLLVVLLTISTFTLAQSQIIRRSAFYSVYTASGVELDANPHWWLRDECFSGPVNTFYPLNPFYPLNFWYYLYPAPSFEVLPWVNGRIIYPAYRRPTDLEEAPKWEPAERQVYDWDGTFRPAEPDPLIRKAINPKANDPARDVIIKTPEVHPQERPGRGSLERPQPRRTVPGPDRRTRSPYTFPNQY